MKKNKLTTAVVAGLAGMAGMANAAMHISTEGTGQVLIYPYYTVNNDLVTTYSVVNTTDETKAIKVRFLEGDNSLEVLDFNVYMSAYDVWTGALGATTSTIGAHVGQPSGMHVSFDTSCAPFLTKAGQEFLPYEIDADISNPVTPNKSMERSTQGHFEVIEMGVVTGARSAAADHGTTGVPADCGALEAAWNAGGDWINNAGNDGDLSVPTGGLFGAATILNVAEGLAMTYDATAIVEFWDGATIAHTEPGSLLPSLTEGDVESQVLYNGAVVANDWSTLGGTPSLNAVSSIFMKNSIFNEYALDSAISAKSEWVVTFPTKKLHVNGSSALPPFNDLWDGAEACEEFTMDIFDREEQRNAPGTGVVSPRPPQGTNPRLCQEANVVEFLAPGQTTGAASKVLGATNLTTVSSVTVPHATENGWAAIRFNQPTQMLAAPNSNDVFYGLPVSGFMVQQYTNANAAPGLLAQYAGLFDHKAEVRITSN